MIHLISASIWVGGHLFLALRIIPKAIKEKKITGIKEFKSKFEPIGMPSLLLLLISGIGMAYQYNVTISTWFSFSNAIEKVVSIKLILLIFTFILAMIAEFVIFPKLSESNILKSVVPMLLVTLLAVIMLIIGSFIRFGGLP